MVSVLVVVMAGLLGFVIGCAWMSVPSLLPGPVAAIRDVFAAWWTLNVQHRSYALLLSQGTGLPLLDAGNLNAVVTVVRMWFV